MRRRLFIGSSSEGIKIALQVKGIIEASCGEWLECTIWNEVSVFSFNKSFLESLISASRRFDYGILIATADDIALFRRYILKIPRDNVVFEMGLFLGSLGLKRAFLLADAKSKLPTDYNGISIPKFNSNNLTDRDLKGLIDEINSTKNSFLLRPVPSAALALGYFDNFVLPLSKNQASKEFTLKVLLPKTLADLDDQIRLHKLTNPSVEISVYGDGNRPIAYKYQGEELRFWDIPTTLKTLEKLISMIVSVTEVGLNTEHADWTEYEVRNFKGALEVLIQESPFCKEKVFVELI